jgi:hypothetical protein
MLVRSLSICLTRDLLDVPIRLDLLGYSAAGARFIPPILRDLVLIRALEE